MSMQVLREWLPGYGGVERVAHELASVWGELVFSLDAQPERRLEQDPLPVSYPRSCLPRFALGRLLLPWPSRLLWQLLFSSKPLHGHLPSPAVLMILLLARLLRPGRRVSAHWHCFLERSAGFSGSLFELYQHLALLVVPNLSAVVTTSPLLAAALQRCGCRAERIKVLPCCLEKNQERVALAVPFRVARLDSPLQALFIGRLDSYKRLDWLMQSLSELQQPWHLQVVGDGPRREAYERQARQLFGSDPPVSFLGRVDEAAKLACLAKSEVLVLPSDCSNEAFGIVQLEAMAAGIPALAFQRQRSGMGWVGKLPGLAWSQQPEDLATVLQRLAKEPQLRRELGIQARERYQEFFARKVWRKHLDALF